MRNLTLDERISIRGRFENKGLTRMREPLKTTSDYIHYWRLCFGSTIADWYKVSIPLIRKHRKG